MLLLCICAPSHLARNCSRVRRWTLTCRPCRVMARQRKNRQSGYVRFVTDTVVPAGHHHLQDLDSKEGRKSDTVNVFPSFLCSLLNKFRSYRKTENNNFFMFISNSSNDRRRGFRFQINLKKDDIDIRSLQVDAEADEGAQVPVERAG